MYNERLGALIGNAAVTGQALTAEAVAGVLEDHELLAEVQRRNLLVGEAAMGFAINASEATEAAPAIEVPKPDEETAERLEQLPADYREHVLSSYAQRYVAVAGYIDSGKLPEAYRLPELGTLMERVEALASSFEHQTGQGWEPAVEFVPQGLSREQWSGLLHGHKLPDGRKMQGAYTTFSGEGETVDPTSAEAVDSFWDVAVISTTDRPVFTNVSKDGTHGSYAKKVVKALSAMPSVTDISSPEAVIATASPREEVYNAMQLSRLERGEQPVDARTWTISKENIEVDWVIRSVFRRFDPYKRRVRSGWGGLHGALDDGGVRPSASGRDLIA